MWFGLRGGCCLSLHKDVAGGIFGEGELQVRVEDVAFVVFEREAPACESSGAR